MPRIDNTNRLNAEDFPDESRELIERLAVTYNFFVEQVTNVLNGSVDFENLDRNLVILEFDMGANNQPLTATRFTATPGLQGTNIIRVDNLTNSANYPDTAPFLSFTTNGNGVYTINSITGLDQGNKYRVVIELIF